MLETRIEELTKAVEALTVLMSHLATQQPPAPAEVKHVVKAADVAANCNEFETMQETKERLQRDGAPNEQSKSTPDTSQTSAEESKPALTYVDNVKPITLRLLKEKGRLTYVDNVKPITLRLSKEKGRDTAIAVLGRFGVKGAQDLDAGQWAEYIAHCEKVLAGGEV